MARDGERQIENAGKRAELRECDTKRDTNETRIRTCTEHDGKKAQCANVILPATNTLSKFHLKVRCVNFKACVDPFAP